MGIDIKSEIGFNMSITVVIPNALYISSINSIAKQLSENYNKVCYVSLNKLYQPLVRALAGNQADINKFFFIDGITKTAMTDVGDIPNCFFVSGPDKITEIGIAIQKVVSVAQCQVLLFDSLSTLLVYHDVQIIKQFVHSIVGQVTALNCIVVFTCLEGTTENDLLKDISMFVDNIAHVQQ